MIICEQAHQLGSTKENTKWNGIVEVTLAIIIVAFCYYYRFHRETMYWLSKKQVSQSHFTSVTHTNTHTENTWSSRNVCLWMHVCVCDVYNFNNMNERAIFGRSLHKLRIVCLKLNTYLSIICLEFVLK